MAKVQKVLAMLDASFPEDVKAAIAKMTLKVRPFYLPSWFMNKYVRDGFGPGPAQPKSARAYIPTWPKIGPGPKAAQRTPAQIGLGPNFFGPGPAQEIFGPKK